MRTIVAFLLTAIAAAAQTPAEIERLEKGLADHPGNHGAYQKALTTTEGVPLDQLRTARRALILWLIEHQPESKMFEEPFSLLWLRGRMGDPEGFAEAAQLWRDLAAKPASAKALANAALFFRATTPSEGFAILDSVAQEHPGDPELARARGILLASVMLGVSGIGESNNRIRLVTSGANRASSVAKQAFQSIEASKDAHLVGGAGDLLTRGGTIDIPYDFTSGDDDAPALADRWLRRARELAPPGDEWKTPLSTALRQRAQRTNDPSEKLRLLREAYDLAPDAAKRGMQGDMALAEFASGNDALSEQDARALAETPQNPSEYNLGQTLLGRLAIARGNTAQAKELLLASVNPPAKFKNPVFEPNMTLAQDLYDAGDKDAVIAFLEASRNIWKFDRGRIDRMISFVKKAPSADLVQLSRQFPGNEIVRRPAPAFEATDADGNMVTREQLAGKVVALEFGKAPLAEKVSRDFASRGVVLLQIQDDDTRRRFEVLTNPTLVVIDRQGNVSGYRSGAATEADWRNEFESGFGRGPNPSTLPAPKQLDSPGRIAWEPVENAESYVVEWDPREEQGWVFDRDHSVRVVPTRETSTTLDLTGLTRVRWRVYAVPRNGPAGTASPWREIEAASFTKIYK